MNRAITVTPVLGRILLALIFVLAGIRKLGALAATSATMARHGIPHADILVWGAIALELGGGLALMAGLLTRLTGAALFLYLLALAVIFHPYWAAAGAEFATQRAAFYQHLSMMGGMLYVVAFGAGPCSIDALIRSRPAPRPLAAA